MNSSSTPIAKCPLTFPKDHLSQVMYRDLDANGTGLRCPGWRKCPPRHLWHEMCGIARSGQAYADEAGINNSVLTVESLIRINARVYAHNQARDFDSSPAIVFLTKPGRQRAVAGQYLRVRPNIGQEVSLAGAAVAQAATARARLSQNNFPHSTLLSQLGTDNFFGVFTSAGSTNLAQFLIGRCILKVIHCLYQEDGIFPGMDRVNFVSRVMVTAIIPGVHLYHFFDTERKLRANIKKIVNSHFGQVGLKGHVGGTNT